MRIDTAHVVNMHVINLNLAGQCVLHGSNVVLSNVTSDADIIIFNGDPTRACIITDCKMNSTTYWNRTISRKFNAFQNGKAPK